ncbi:hypothetical protein HYU22_04115 [Candidatus Woesearchaeota archaeon]|nr:hypothetical protein [Candidatus Woesearchaeota archaeon]
MTETALNQNYFTASDIGNIVDVLMGILLAEGIAVDRKVAATQALNAVRILRDRLGMKKEVLEFIYTNETFAPRPLARFMKSYLQGGYTTEEAKNVLEGLEADMRRNYFQRKIHFDDPSKLPKSIILDPTGQFAEDLIDRVEATIAEYNPRVNSKAAAQEIYQQACKNPTGRLDFNTLAKGVAEIIAQSNYPSLVLSVGARNPTAREFAGHFLNALQLSYKKLGTEELAVFGAQKLIDREAIVKERMQEEVYQRELESYRKNLEGLLIL